MYDSFDLDEDCEDYIEGAASSLAKAKASALIRPHLQKLINEHSAPEGARGEGIDVTGKEGSELALRGLPRPTMSWKGARDLSHTVMGLEAAAGKDVAKKYKERFGRKRKMPVMYSTEVAGAASTSCSGGRLLECLFDYLCSCCGESIESMSDQTGWIVDDGDGFGTPGSPLCTRCCRLTLKMCPHYVAAMLQGRLDLWRISDRRGFGPSPDMRDEGGCMPRTDSGAAHESSVQELQSYYTKALAVIRKAA